MDKIQESLTNLDLNKSDKINFKSVLYYELKFDQDNYDKIVKLVLDTLNLHKEFKSTVSKDTTDLVVINNNNNGDQQYKYKVNDEFHITVLYTGGKEDQRAQNLTKYLGQKFDVEINKIGINNQFITIGVNIVGDIPYYGNDVTHITFGLNKFTPFEKKPLPKDSYLALLPNDQNHLTVFDLPIVVKSIFDVKTK